MSNDTTREDFEAWLDRPSSHNPDTSMRKRSTAMERVFALHAWQAATAQGKRQQLTDEQIQKILFQVQIDWAKSPPAHEFAPAFARAIENSPRHIDMRGQYCEVLDDDMDSKTYLTWLPGRFLTTDLIGNEPIVQIDGCMPWFTTWKNVRGIDKNQEINYQQELL